MTHETRERLARMGRQRREQRFQELLEKHRILNAEPLPRSGQPPIPIPLEEMEEREWLKKDLGYN